MANMVTDAQGQSYMIGEYIDRGSFSKVYTLQCCRTERQFAGKFVSKEKLKKYGVSHKVWDEIKIHQYLRHKHIVQFYTYIEREQHIVIVLEYCSKYSLTHVLRASETLRPCEAKYFMLQIVSAVEYLHNNHIVHRDLKLGNCFLDQHLQVKLGDFGLAVVIEYEGQMRFSRCGTPNYISPEVINGTGHSYNVDVWALGCVLYTLLEGTPPFQGTDTATTYNKILSCKYRYSPHLDQAAKLLIMSCLQTDPDCRPVVFDLISFEFLSSDVQPEPPRVNFEEYKKQLASVRKRRRTESVTNKEKIDIRKVPNGNRCPFNCYAKLSSVLSNVWTWRESEFAGCLSEVASVKPNIWVNSWMDFSNSCGFAYQLSNGNIGIIFNDTTRMLLIYNQSVHFVKPDGSMYVFNSASVPSNLQKKLDTLISCGKYMSTSLVRAHDEVSDSARARVGVFATQVFGWTRGEDETVMFLSNGSVQVNFGSDHAKLVLCAVSSAVTCIERPDRMRTLSLELLQRFGCGAGLKRKLALANEYISRVELSRSSSFTDH